MRSWMVVGALVLVCACNALTPIEQQEYDNLIAQGAEPLVEKKPAVAAALNLLPGFGDIYNGEWGAFVLDLLLWVPSVLWAVPQGAITAGNINKKATIAFYSFGPGRDQGFDPHKSPGAPPKPTP